MDTTITIIASVVTTVVATWLLGFLKILPAPVDVVSFCWEILLDIRFILVPSNNSDRFVILIAKLDGDDARGTHTRAIVRAFQGTNRIQRTKTNRILRISDPGIDGEADAIKTGRRWLLRRQADLLIWGEVLETGKAINLRFTGSDIVDEFPPPSRYLLETNLLPTEFAEVATDRLIVFALSAVKIHSEMSGRDIVDLLRPTAKRLHRFLETNTAISSAMRFGIWNGIGAALSRVGVQTGETVELDNAIVAFDSALEIADSNTSSEELARTHHLRAITFARRAAITGSIEDSYSAVGAFSASLKLRNENAEPYESARTLGGLTMVNCEIAERNGDIVALKDALNIFLEIQNKITRDRFPQEWALLETRIGITNFYLYELAMDVNDLKKSIESYDCALQISSRRNVPLIWSMLQNNKGNSLLDLGKRDGSREIIERALECFTLALDETPKSRSPIRWAAGKINLAVALMTLGENYADKSFLEESVEDFKSALSVAGLDRASRHFAIAQIGLATALKGISEHLTQPKVFISPALRRPPGYEDVRPQNPNWVDDAEQLRTAVDTLRNRALALQMLEEAVDCCKKAISSPAVQSATTLLAHAHTTFAEALMHVYRLEPNHENENRVIAAISSAESIFTRERFPLLWAELQHKRAVLCNHIGEIADDESLAVSYLSRAAQFYETVFSLWKREDGIVFFAQAQSNFGILKAVLGSRIGNADQIRQGVDLIERSIETLAALNLVRSERIARANLAAAAAWLEGLEASESPGE